MVLSFCISQLYDLYHLHLIDAILCVNLTTPKVVPMNSVLARKRATLQRFWPGIAIAAVIALAASFISSSYGGPQLLFALFIGLAFHFL